MAMRAATKAINELQLFVLTPDLRSLGCISQAIPLP
jgi:hypothetical protein